MFVLMRILEVFQADHSMFVSLTRLMNSLNKLVAESESCDGMIAFIFRYGHTDELHHTMEELLVCVGGLFVKLNHLLNVNVFYKTVQDVLW